MKASRNVRLELAAELLKLEAKLDENIASSHRTHRDVKAAELMAEARDHLLCR